MNEDVQEMIACAATGVCSYVASPPVQPVKFPPHVEPAISCLMLAAMIVLALAVWMGLEDSSRGRR
jgi:hypothetical protein